MGKFFKFRTLEVMKLRGVYREGRASKMGNLTGPFYKHNFITSKVLNLKTLLSSSRFPIEKCEVCLRDIEDVSQANLTIFKF